MTKAIRIHRNGDPDVLRWEDIDLPSPADGEVRIRHTAIAVNFSDINVRRGGFYLAKPLQFPLILGNEAAGVVEGVGPNVHGVQTGDRVAYVGVGGPFYESTGAYAQARNVPAACLIKLPDGIPDHTAAAALVKGLTASMVNHVYRPKSADVILIHAAASGVGLLLSQWAKHLGATVIGTVGSREKADVACAHGCAHAILYRETDFVAGVRAIAPHGASAVFDGVGKDTFMRSLDCVRPFGMLVNYGNASGPVPPFDPLLLSKKGSLSISRVGLSHYLGDPVVYRAACDELFALIERGVLKVNVGRTYALEDAAKAHRDLESRAIAGSVVLIP